VVADVSDDTKETYTVIYSSTEYGTSDFHQKKLLIRGEDHFLKISQLGSFKASAVAV